MKSTKEIAAEDILSPSKAFLNSHQDQINLDRSVAFVVDQATFFEFGPVLPSAAGVVRTLTEFQHKPFISGVDGLLKVLQQFVELFWQLKISFLNGHAQFSRIEMGYSRYPLQVRGVDELFAVLLHHIEEHNLFCLVIAHSLAALPLPRDKHLDRQGTVGGPLHCYYFSIKCCRLKPLYRIQLQADAFVEVGEAFALVFAVAADQPH